MQRHLAHQPDDPGTGTIECVEVVRFIVKEFGREIAAIGNNPVGSIEPTDWGKLKRATWRCGLFEGALCARADSNLKAKVALLHRIADWHDLAGPLYATHARLIRLQAEEIAP